MNNSTSETMPKKKSKKQIEDEAFEELKRRAMEPFKPTLTKEEQLMHEAELREKSIKNIKEMKENISDTDIQNIRSRADFEHSWNT